MGLLGIEPQTEGCEAARVRGADALHEEGRDLRRHDADRHLRRADLRALLGNDPVRNGDKAHAAAHASALDERDQGLRKRVGHLEEGAEAAVRGGRGFLGPALRRIGFLHALEIAAGAEVAARTHHHQDPHRIVVARLCECLAKLGQHLRRQRIAHIGPAERDLHHRPVVLDDQRLIRHALSSRPRHSAPLPLAGRGRGWGYPTRATVLLMRNGPRQHSPIPVWLHPTPISSPSSCRRRAFGTMGGEPRGASCHGQAATPTGYLFRLPGKIPMCLQMMDSMISSAPPPMDPSRVSR